MVRGERPAQAYTDGYTRVFAQGWAIFSPETQATNALLSLHLTLVSSKPTGLSGIRRTTTVDSVGTADTD